MVAPTVFEKFSNFKAFKRHDGDFGLEIETETLEPYTIPKMGLWETHADGSLRNHGVEYVLKAPLKFGPDLEAAYTEFTTKTAKFPFIEDSITTSVHVHMNILNENLVTVGNIFTVYALVENILIEFSGPSRKSNLFCLGMADAEETYKGIKQILTAWHGRNYAIVQNFDRDNAKYAALNLAAMNAFGSLEFRSFRGTADIGVIRRWVGILHALMSYCRQNITPHDIIKEFKNKGMEILNDIFGEYRRELRCKNEDELVDRNFWYAAQIAYCIKDWEVLRKEPSKKKPSAKDLDKYATMLYGREFNAIGSDEQRYILNHIDEIIESYGNQPTSKPKKARGGAMPIQDAVDFDEEAVNRAMNDIRNAQGGAVPPEPWNQAWARRDVVAGRGIPMPNDDDMIFDEPEPDA